MDDGPATGDRVPRSAPEDRALGLDRSITRRDFLNASLLGAGASLLHLAPPGVARAAPHAPWHPWTGYAGVGDYARSNGNTWEVIQAAHAMRDHRYDTPPVDVVETGETYDLVVCGGGFAGLGAALRFRELAGPSRTILLLDNHALVGGEAKRNEFLVRGQRLIGPQGSNDFGVPPASSGWLRELWDRLGLPDHFQYATLGPGAKPLEFAGDNYYFQLWADDFESHGYFFDAPSPHWVRNPFGHALEGTPWPDEVRRDLLRWRSDTRRYHDGDDVARWLDTMTYERYLVGVMGLHPEVARYADPILAAAIGLGADVLSAYSAYQIRLPGFQGFEPPGTPPRSFRLRDIRTDSFPGGNDGIARHFVKALVPEAIGGGRRFEDVLNGRIDLAALDRRGGPTRLRVEATAVRVEHDAGTAGRRGVLVTYVKDGRPYRVRARGVVMATGGWSAKHAVRDLPAEYHEAFEHFPRSPMLVVNVALTNWRPLHDLGYTAASWSGGLGFSGNLRPNMIVGDYHPPLDPDRPNLFTMYVPFGKRGLSLVEQGHAGRAELLSTSYADYERAIRRQMVRLFADAGFDPRRDIAGIVLNRWGHAYVNPAPGFYFGREGAPAPRDVIRRPHGRIAFAHSELNGHQNWVAAVTEGRRAAEQMAGAM